MIRMTTLALCLMASGAMAQTSSLSGSPFAPGDPSRSRPVEYKSVFEDPRPAESGIDWRGANEEVGRLRGHAGQLRDEAPPRQDQTKPAMAPAAPAQPHHGH